MSVIAFTTTPEQIILLSDGRKSSEATREVTAMNSSKAYTLNDHIGFFWLGYTPFGGASEKMISILESCESVKAAAQRAGKFLRMIFRGERLDKLKGPDRLRFCVIVIGYSDGKPVLYQLDSEHEKMFTPKQIPCQVGQSGLLGYGTDSDEEGNRYSRLMKNFTSSLSLKEACAAAFTAVVGEMEAAGEPVGGMTFCKTLQPKKQSKFRQALLN